MIDADGESHSSEYAPSISVIRPEKTDTLTGAESEPGPTSEIEKESQVAVPQAWKTRQTADEKTDILARHKRLAWAIANRDADEAEQAMAAHFDEAIGELLR